MTTRPGTTRDDTRATSHTEPASSANLSAVPELLTREEACERLRISLTALNRLMQSGGLYSFKVGRQRRIPEAAVDALIAGERYTPRDRTHEPDHETGTQNLVALAERLERRESESEADRQQRDDRAAVDRAQIRSHTKGAAVSDCGAPPTREDHSSD
jgi:excisionase family DNA binding protein